MNVLLALMKKQMTSKTILLALGALVLLNGIVGVLLWSGTPPILGDALVGAMPYAPSRRLVISVWPVATQLRSYPDNLVRSPSDHQHSPREVWVHVWTHDVGQHTGMNRIVVLLQLRRLAVLPLLAMSPCLALLLAVWVSHCWPSMPALSHPRGHSGMPARSLPLLIRFPDNQMAYRRIIAYRLGASTRTAAEGGIG